jgi:histone H3/H4
VSPIADRTDFDPDRTLEQLRELQRLHAEGGFSANAVDTLAARQAEYVEEVSQEATRIARRNRSDLVSAADVEAADQKLHRDSPGRAGLLELLGGAIFGAGLSEFIAVMTTAEPGHLGIAFGCGGMVVGLFAIAFARSGRG